MYIMATQATKETSKMFRLYRITIGDRDSKTLFGIHETWEAAAKDMDRLGYSEEHAYIIEEG